MFVKMLKVRATNPNTGDVTEYWKVRTAENREYKVIATEEQLKETGSMDKLLNSLVLRSGPYGDYVTLRRSEVIEDAKLF